MEALNEALLEPTNGASRDADGAAPVRLEWAGVGVVAGRKRRVILSEAGGVARAGCELPRRARETRGRRRCASRAPAGRGGRA